MIHLVTLFVCMYLASATEPEKCCIADNWQGKVAQVMHVSATNQFMEFDYEYAYKRDERLGGLRILDPFTGKELNRGVIDFETNHFYNITGSTCAKSARPWVMVEPFSCLPEKAQYLGEYYVGGIEDEWKGDYWAVRDLTDEVKFIEIVFSKNCALVYERVTMEVGTQIQLTANFRNATSSITDPTIFDIPEDCPYTETNFYQQLLSVGSSSSSVHNLAFSLSFAMVYSSFTFLFS